MHISSDGDFSPEWQDDGTVTRTGYITFTESGSEKAAMRVLLALVDDEGTTDVHLIYGPVGVAGVDQRSSLVLRGDAGRAFLRLAVRAFRAQRGKGKDDGE